MSYDYDKGINSLGKALREGLERQAAAAVEVIRVKANRHVDQSKADRLAAYLEARHAGAVNVMASRQFGKSTLMGFLAQMERDALVDAGVVAHPPERKLAPGWVRLEKEGQYKSARCGATVGWSCNGRLVGEHEDARDAVFAHERDGAWNGACLACAEEAGVYADGLANVAIDECTDEIDKAMPFGWVRVPFEESPAKTPAELKAERHGKWRREWKAGVDETAQYGVGASAPVQEDASMVIAVSAVARMPAIPDGKHPRAARMLREHWPTRYKAEPYRSPVREVSVGVQLDYAEDHEGRPE